MSTMKHLIAAACLYFPAATGWSLQDPQSEISIHSSDPPQVREVPTYTIEQFMGSTMIGGASFSPDGKTILVSSDQTGVANAYAIPVAGGEPIQLTRSDKESIYTIGYFPADERFLFASDRGGDELTHIYVQYPNGTVRDLTPGENVMAAFHSWSPDGRSFFFTTNERDPLASDLYEMTVDDYERDVLYLNERGLEVAAVSPDRRLVALFNRVTNNETDLLLYNRETGETTNLGDVATLRVPLPGRAAFSPDGQGLYLLSNEMSEFSYLVRHDLATGEPTTVLEPGWDVMQVLFSPTGRYLAVGVNHDARFELRVLDAKTYEPVALPSLPGRLPSAISFLNPFAWSVAFAGDDGKMAFYGRSGSSPAELHVLDFDEGVPRKLTNAQNPTIDPAHLVEPRPIRFDSYDGLEIPGFIYRPHGASREARVPAVIILSGGGPGGQYPVLYDPLAQALVNHGYAVYAINHRGNSGYGKSYYAADDLRHGEADLGDVVASKAMLIETGWIDPERIGIMGASYGGFLAMAALTFHPEEFQAGVNLFGVTNWIRTLESIPPILESVRAALYSELGDPATDRDRLHRISPLFHADRITKPFIVLQGANDPRVLQVESDEIVAAARANGIPVEYIVFPDEGHGFRKKENRLQANQAILTFLDRHLKGQGVEKPGLKGTNSHSFDSQRLEEAPLNTPEVMTARQ